jgi:thiol-disulfide isomerase/thioredoxin
MRDWTPFPSARVRVIPLAAAITVSACLGAGCATKEPPVASAPSETPTGGPSVASQHASQASSDKLAVSQPTSTSVSTTVASSGATAEPAVKVEPVSPEEYKKYIASQRGKVVFVDFWATYCLPCREKYPRTLALAKKYAGQGLSVASMSLDSPEPAYQKQVLDFLTKQKSEIKNFANRLEDTDAAFAGLEIAGGALPHYKIYGRDGKLRNKFGGDPDHPYDEADIERALVAALKEH